MVVICMSNKSECPRCDNDKKECLKCGSFRRLSDFYMSNSPYYRDKKHPICKNCIKSQLKLDSPHSQEAIESVKDVMLNMNKPFIYSLWISSIEESEKTRKNVFGLYMKNLMQNSDAATWRDSDFNDNSKTQESLITYEELNKQDNIENDNRDKDDVIRMLGYDPFEHESEEDKKILYSKLIDFLDESTLEDGFKLQAVIEIVTGFNQIDKINHAITNITKDISKLSDKSGGIKSLIDSKKNILSSLLGLAKDNGISVNNNNNKSKGAGTLSGIIKNLQEKGIEAGEINVFDIETCEGMRQVADISNKSILDQLMLNENDYTEMIKDQKEMIHKFENKLNEIEEENRLLKIKLKTIEST